MKFVFRGTKPRLVFYLSEDGTPASELVHPGDVVSMSIPAGAPAPAGFEEVRAPARAPKEPKEGAE